MSHHKANIFGIDLFCGYNEIAFILTVFIVSDDNGRSEQIARIVVLAVG